MKNYLLMILLILSLQTHAGILWVGGEDIDFQGGQQICSTTSGGYFRPGYARLGLHSCHTSNPQVGSSTTPFAGGSVTSVWLSARVYGGNLPWAGQIPHYIGLGKFGTSNSLWVGVTNANRYKLALLTYNGTVWVEKAIEAGQSITAGALNKIDMQVINYGVAGTVNIYVNGSSSPKLTFTGDLTVGGNTDLNDVKIMGMGPNIWGHTPWVTISEVVVADTDTRALSVVTMTPNASGTINNWAGGFANVNPITIDDGSMITSTSPGEVFQTEVSNLPANSVSVQAVKVAARSFSNGGSPSTLSLGVFTNGVASEPAALALTPSWDTKEAYYHTNPVTTMPWLPTEINLLQLNLKSAP